MKKNLRNKYFPQNIKSFQYFFKYPSEFYALAMGKTQLALIVILTVCFVMIL